MRILLVGITLLLTQEAHAQLGFDTTSLLNALTQQINTPTAQAAIKALISITGFATDFRPYQPATPLGTSLGVDMGVELTLVRLAPNLLNDISTATGSSSLTSLPSIPIPMLHFHKGFGKFDLGLGYLGFLPKPYNVYQVWGSTIKVIVYEPPEGLIWAVRFNYTTASFDMIKTSTYTPQILVSRPLSFADPYIGIGYEMVSGLISGTLSQSVPVIGVVTAPVSATGSASAFQGFGGVAFKFDPTGVKLTLEMAYNSAGMSHMGAKFGLCF